MPVLSSALGLIGVSRASVLHALHGAMYWTGLAGAWRAARPSPVAVVLCYHSVPSPVEAPWIDPANAIPPGRFRAQMKLLARLRTVISMSDLVARLEAGAAPPAHPAVVVTFDDGYRDFLAVAAPILAEFGLPATLYLVTGYVSRGEPQWIDRLYAAATRRTRDSATVLGERMDFRRGPASPAYRDASRKLLTASPAERAAMLDDLEGQLAPSAATPRLTLTWDDVREVRRRYPLVEIGAHTVEHRDVSSCPLDVARSEVRRSAGDIERELGIRPAHFSFPYGRSTPETRALVREEGFRSAVIWGDELVVRAGTDAYAIPRVGQPESATALRFKTSGAYPDLSRRLLGGRA